MSFGGLVINETASIASFLSLSAFSAIEAIKVISLNRLLAICGNHSAASRLPTIYTFQNLCQRLFGALILTWTELIALQRRCITINALRAGQCGKIWTRNFRFPKAALYHWATHCYYLVRVVGLEPTTFLMWQILSLLRFNQFRHTRFYLTQNI